MGCKLCGQGARQDGQGDEHKDGRTGGIETVVDEAVEQHDADANVSGQAQGAGGAHRTHHERAKPDAFGRRCAISQVKASRPIMPCSIHTSRKRL